MTSQRTDRELLELAAKAAEINVCPDGIDWVYNELGTKWNPLTDDGDALRLSVKLRMTIITLSDSIEVNSYDNTICGQAMTNEGQDPLAATRRAITLAAAEIGVQMP